jgi:hypothetical protein
LLDEYRIGDLWEKNLIGGIMLRIGIQRIGLNNIRQACPRFNGWLIKLENLT